MPSGDDSAAKELEAAAAGSTAAAASGSTAAAAAGSTEAAAAGSTAAAAAARTARTKAASAHQSAAAARVGSDAGAVDLAREDAVEARDEAVAAKHSAEVATRDADAALEESEEVLEELLIHPSDDPQLQGDQPFGTPGEPISRRAPFYIGFVGGLGVLLALLVGLVIRAASPVIVLILVSMFLAVGLNPLVEWLILRGFRRRISVLLVTVGVLMVVTLFGVTLVPIVQDQVLNIVTNGPDLLDQLLRNRTVQRLDGKYDVIGAARDRLQDPDFAKQIFGGLFAAGLAVFNALVNAFLIFVLTLYFLSTLPAMKRACYSLAPESRRTRVTYLGDEILRRVGGYVAGVFLVSLCAGVSSFVFLEIIGLGQYALALALVVAILDFIPLIGATIGATIVTLIAFATSPTLGLICVVFYISYQQVENYVLYPRIMSSSVDVPGVVTVVAVLIGGSLMGVVGAMLAIPTAAATLLLIREIWVRSVDDA